jgi:hypothetical protein
MLGTRPRRTTVLFTMASMVATINSLVGGVGVALLAAEVLDTHDVLAILLGAATAVASIAAAYRYQTRRYSAAAAA